MNFDFLPEDIKLAISKLNVDKLTEIRLRIGYPILINYCNQRVFLSVLNGHELRKENSIICIKSHIDFIIDKVCERSIYAYNDRICNGYLTTSDGIRIGVAGECVFNKDNIVTIKDFSSLNIRIPHIIKGCCDVFYQKLFNENGKLLNTLIISPPFFGKTTLLKDLAIKLNEETILSILIIDERGEFSQIKGENIDVIKYSDKYYAFNYALRSLSPNIVITDELINERDWLYVKNAVNSGVIVVASIHSDSIINLQTKSHFIHGLFDRYVLLDSIKTPGVVKNVFNKDFIKI